MHDDTWHLHGIYIRSTALAMVFGWMNFGGLRMGKLASQDCSLMCQDTRRQRHQTHSPDLL